MSFHLDTSDDVAVLTFDRPPVNALDLDLVLKLEKTFEEISKAPPKNGLVMTGAGSSYSAGVDTRSFFAYDHDGRAQQILGITRTIAKIYALPVPVVGAINGHALGGGFVLVLACDLRLAPPDPSVRMGLTEAKAGVPFPAGPLEVIRAELAPDPLRLLTLTSAVVNPIELHRQGIIDELVERDQLVETAKTRAREIASQPGFGIVKPQLRAPTIERLRALAASGKDPLIEALRRAS